MFLLPWHHFDLRITDDECLSCRHAEMFLILSRPFKGLENNINNSLTREKSSKATRRDIILHVKVN